MRTLWILTLVFGFNMSAARAEEVVEPAEDVVLDSPEAIQKAVKQLRADSNRFYKLLRRHSVRMNEKEIGTLKGEFSAGMIGLGGGPAGLGGVIGSGGGSISGSQKEILSEKSIYRVNVCPQKYKDRLAEYDSMVRGLRIKATEHANLLAEFKTASEERVKEIVKIQEGVGHPFFELEDESDYESGWTWRAVQRLRQHCGPQSLNETELAEFGKALPKRFAATLDGLKLAEGLSQEEQVFVDRTVAWAKSVLVYVVTLKHAKLGETLRGGPAVIMYGESKDSRVFGGSWIPRSGSRYSVPVARPRVILDRFYEGRDYGRELFEETEESYFFLY